MRRSLHDRRDSARSFAIVALVHVALGWALLTGLGVTPVPAALQQPLAVISLRDEPPPPPPVVPMTPEKKPTPSHKPKDPEGAAAPPNKRNTPTPVVAPKPLIVLPPPPPLPAAPVAGQGTAPAAGAAPVIGPGTGRGGVGNGLGSGLSGDGTGGGGGGGSEDGPEYLGGELAWSDVPPAVQAQRPSGRVFFRLRVSRFGQVTDCRIVRSSGSPGLDAATCQGALRKLRFGPAVDRAGRPIDAWTETNEHEWVRRRAPRGEAPDDGPDDD
ncbi:MULTISPECIES: energy transducer TonB [Sphingomonas]|uniref:energy transducer TonB n=1 Tax=Sphingomonas TaxID=13687 RepID=UPI001F080424|nr:MULTISPECIES: energy transducer TonB [Sphingomonas]